MHHPNTFCLHFLLPLALCRCLIWAVHLQIDGQYEPDKHKLPAWQRLSPTIGMSPNSTRQVTDVKLRLAAWIEKPFSRRNASARHAQLMLDSHSDTDQSGNASPANFVNSPDQRSEQRTTQGQEIVPAHSRGKQTKRSGSRLGSIYFKREFADQYAPSPLSDATRHYTYDRDQYNLSDLNDQSGKEIVPVGYDYDGQIDHANQINVNRAIVTSDHYEIESDTSNAKLRRSFSDVPDQKRHHTKGLKRIASDFALKKCGMMPKLGKMPSLSGKMSHLKSKMKHDMILWKKCIKHSFSDTYLQTANALKHLVEHKHNANDQKDGSKRSKEKLFLHDHAEWEEDGTPKRELDQTKPV